MMCKARLLVQATLALLLAVVSPAHAQTVSGKAEAVDGDSLLLTGTRIRLFGIDAVEGGQTCNRDGQEWACGKEAQALLASLIEGQTVQCTRRETDIYGRKVSVCMVNNVDLADQVVRLGYAIALRNISLAYVDAEERAKELGLGIWASEFSLPSDWRQAQEGDTPPPRSNSTQASISAQSRGPRVYRDSAGNCAIKGNHSSKGEWIYHLPGQRYYGRTRPEAMFCTEQEARQAGYRRSKV